MVIVGWHYFWCRSLDAAGTKATGAGAAVRLPQRVPQPGLRHARRLRQAVPRRRLRRRVPRARAVRVPEPHRLGDRHPDADLPGDHHVDAVLVRPLLRRADRRRSRGGVDARPRRVPRVARGTAPREAAPRGDREAHEEGSPPRRRSRRRRRSTAPAAKIAPSRDGRRRDAVGRAKSALARAFSRSKDKDRTRRRPRRADGRRRPEVVRAAQAAEGRRAARCRCPIPSR